MSLNRPVTSHRLNAVAVDSILRVVVFWGVLFRVCLFACKGCHEARGVVPFRMDMKDIQCLVWNLEWASVRSKRGKMMQGVLAASRAHVMCLTEIEQGMYPAEGHVVEAEADYGYPNPPGRRKVILWSKSPWSGLHLHPSGRMPGGRFVSGVTAGIRFVGVGIPWRDAHVSTGRRDRRPWEEHLAYLDELDVYLGDVSAGHEPICVCGDYNQRIPPRRQPKGVYEKLSQVFQRHSLSIVTAGQKDEEDKLLIDHLAVGSGIHASVEYIIPKTGDAGMKLSDHSGLACSLSASVV